LGRQGGGTRGDAEGKNDLNCPVYKTVENVGNFREQMRIENHLQKFIYSFFANISIKNADYGPLDR